MKTKTILLSAILLMTAASANEISVKQEGIKYIKMLGGTLKTELQAQMKADKTGTAALQFCIAQANELTKEVNSKLPDYALVRRTSYKLRNSKDNASDNIDKKIMNDYVASIEAKTFSPKDIKVVKDGDTTRIYKPLLTQDACLKCHGKNVSKDLQDAIKVSYPNDNSLGHEKGSLRGVVVSEIKKH